jgi:mRNA-degrading endonuclease toxin of MazEF toxin-antitoxin module
MPWPCALAVDTTGPIAKGLLIERITTLSAEKMHLVCRALNSATNC